MGTIVLHAGMPKAGSSSIQSWLHTNDALLRGAGWHVVVYNRDPTTARVTFEPAAGRGVNSATVVRHYNKSNRDPRVLDAFFQPLDTLAAELGNVVVTGEGFARLFAEADPAFLARLRTLADRHDVRVAYYVRAQHEAIEAAWRQWGFRQAWEPRGYVELRARLLDYAETRSAITQRLPEVTFGIRLFHREALRDTDVVADFVTTFLEPGLAAGDTDVWANPGLPLELVNVLRQAEPGRFWSSAHDNHTIRPLKALAATWKVPETAEIRRSRLVLQQYCHDRFEAGNQHLVRDLAWPIDELVPRPAPARGPDPHSLSELNSLWSSQVSPAERELLFVAIERLLAGQAQALRPRPKRAPRSTRTPRARSVAVGDARSPLADVQLVRDRAGRVHAVQGGQRRLVRSRILANGLEETFGSAREIDDASLAGWIDLGPLELTRGSDGRTYVDLGGRRHLVRGLPRSTLEATGIDLPRGEVIDVAAANVSVRELRAATSLRRQMARVRATVRRRGVFGTVRLAARRVIR